MMDHLDGFFTDPDELARVIGRSEEESDEHFDARAVAAITTSNRIQQLIVGDQMLRTVVELAAMTLEMGRDDILTDTLKVMLWLTGMADGELHRRAEEGRRRKQNEGDETDNVTPFPGQYL